MYTNQKTFKYTLKCNNIKINKIKRQSLKYNYCYRYVNNKKL